MGMRLCSTALLVFGLAVAGHVPAVAQDAPVGHIVWQVQDRFRFFSDPVYFAPHVEAHDAFVAVKQGSR